MRNKKIDMDFQLSEEHLMIRQAARDFAQQELLPGVIERDETQKFPLEQVRKLGEMGFMGMMVDPKYGGAGMDTVSYVLAMEELSKVDASTSVVVSVNNSLVCWGLETFANEEQKMKYLVPLATGKVHGAFLLSEPEAGSDATSQRTTAIDHGDHYILNGTKNWITCGNTADTYLVIAQTYPEKGHKGINVLIVEKNSPGITIGPKEQKMGIRASDTHSVMFQDVKVPKENRIGEDGFGFKFAQMVEAIVRDQKRIFPVCAWLQGEYGLNDVYLGVPVVLGKNGIEKIIELQLNNDEKTLLNESAKAVKEVMEVLDRLNANS